MIYAPQWQETTDVEVMVYASTDYEDNDIFYNKNDILTLK